MVAQINADSTTAYLDTVCSDLITTRRITRHGAILRIL